MKQNVAEIAALQPDYLGFIFFEGSPRNYKGTNFEVPANIKKVGVFVNASFDLIFDKIKEHHLEVIQLHGEETAKKIQNLREELDERGLDQVALWKVFSVEESFDFELIKPYEKFISAFLFDTKGVHRGGNGRAFNWDILQNYPSNTPFILSGGIGPEHLDSLKIMFEKGDLPILAIDVNSKFETEPGRKNSATLKKFMDELQC